MARKKYYTTGEASKILGISRSTVWRRFDDGTLYGKKNPITGERLISKDSLESFMVRYGLSPAVLENDRKKVLVTTPDEGFFTRFERALGEDDRLDIMRANFATDALITCSKDHPDLMLIDEQVSDIQFPDMVKSLRRAEELEGMRIVCVAGSNAQVEFLKWGADEILPRTEETPDIQKMVYSMLEMPVTAASPSLFDHERRRHPRLELKLPANIAVYRNSAPRVQEPGRATLENLSCDGAMLTNIELDAGVIPGEPFRFVVEIDQAPLKKWKAHCRVVRLNANGKLQAGLQFAKISKANLKKVESIMGQEGLICQ